MKRKLLIFPLLIVLLVGSAFSVFASNETTNNGVAVNGGVGAPSKEVKLIVSVNSVFADNIALAVTYDKDVLTMSEKSAWLVSGKDSISDVDVSKGIAAWGAEAMEVKGNILELVFIVNENAQIGATTEVSCQIRANWNTEIELEGLATATVTVKNLAKITGTVTSNGEETAPITVELLNSENTAIDTKTLENGENTYEFEVEQGTYVVRVSKTKHCPREYEVSMEDLENKVQDAKILLYGDVDGNGKLRAADASQIMKYINQKESSISDTDTYIQKVADVDGNGKLRAADASQIMKYINQKESSFDTLP